MRDPMRTSTFTAPSMTKPTTMNRIASFRWSLLFTLGCATLAHAQESKVRWKVNANYKGDPEKGTVFHKVVKGDNGSIVGLQVKGDNPVLGGRGQGDLDRTLVCFDSETLNKIKFDKTKILWGEGAVAFETIEQFQHMFHVIASQPMPDSAKLLLLDQVLSPRGLTGKGARRLAAVPYDRIGKSTDYFKQNMAVGFTTVVSVDSTRLLVQLTPAGTTHSAGCPVLALVFDKRMNLLWSNRLGTDNAARSIDIVSTRIDPQGAVWYLIKNVTDPDPKTKENLGYGYALYRLDSAGQQVAKLDLAGKDFAQDAALDMRIDGTIVVGGVYGDENTNRSESVGAFTCTIDPKTMKFEHIKLLPFQKVVVKKEEHWQTNMHIDRVLAKKAGGVFLVTRKTGIETHYVSDLSGKKVPKTEQVDGALHVFETDANGEQKWYRIIDHELSYDNAVPGLIVSMCYNDVLFILMNDNEGNAEKRKLKQPVDPITSAKDAIIYEFKSDGTDKSKLVLKEKFDQLVLQARQIWRVAPGMVVTTAATGFGKDENWPVVITLADQVKK